MRDSSRKGSVGDGTRVRMEQLRLRFGELGGELKRVREEWLEARGSSDRNRQVDLVHRETDLFSQVTDLVKEFADLMDYVAGTSEEG